MKKKVMRLALAVVTVICLTIPFVFVSFAADGVETNEPLSVEQKVEQKGDKLEVTLTVTNDREELSSFTNLTLTNETPEGYKLGGEDQKSEKYVEELGYEGYASLTTTFVKNPGPTPDPTNPDDPTNPTVGPTDPTDPKTGDTNQIVWFIIMFVLAAGLIAALSIRNVRNKLALAFTSAGHSVAKWFKKNNKKFLPIILGFALLGGMLGATAVKTTAAETDTKSAGSQTIERSDKTKDGVEVYSSVTFTKTEILMPKQGALITLDTQEAKGLENVYRVLKVDGTEAFVMSMWDVSGGGTKFNNVSQGQGMAEFTPTEEGENDSLYLPGYAGSTLDNLLNKEFYKKLSGWKKITDAIVPQPINQKAYGYQYSGGPAPSPYYWHGVDGYNKDYWIIDKCYSASVGTRNIFALDIAEIKAYIGENNLTMGSLKKMFYNIEKDDTRIQSTACWLRSGSTEKQDNNYIYAWSAAFTNGSGNNTHINGECAYNALNTLTYEARAAFVINLAKCDWYEKPED